MLKNTGSWFEGSHNALGLFLSLWFLVRIPPCFAIFLAKSWDFCQNSPCFAIPNNKGSCYSEQDCSQCSVFVKWFGIHLVFSLKKKCLVKIEGIEKDTYDLYQKFLVKKSRHKQDVFDELDRDTKKMKAIKSSYDKINRRLEFE